MSDPIGQFVWLLIIISFCAHWRYSVQDRLPSTEAIRPKLRVEIISPMLASLQILGGMAYTAPAFETAVRDASLKYPLLNLTQTFLVDRRFRSCPEWDAESDHAVASYYLNDPVRQSSGRPDITALIFPGCTEVLGLNALAAQWDILMITSATSYPAQRNKVISPTWITTASNSKTSCIKLYQNLVNKFNWTSVSIIADTSSNIFFITFAKDVQRALGSRPGFQIDFVPVNGTLNADYALILKRVNGTSRVYFYFGHSTSLRNILIKARSMNMANGEHFYFAMMPFRHSSYGNFSWNFGDSFDQEAKEAFRSLFIMEPDGSVYGQGHQAVSLVAEWKLLSEREYNYTYQRNEEISPHPTASYEAIMVFAEVISELHLNALLKDEQFDFSIGKAFARKYFNRAFMLTTGKVSFDDAGERTPGLVLKHLEFDSGQFRVVMMQNDETFGQLVDTETVEWPGIWPVRNRPPCGFRGDECVAANSHSIAIVTSVTASVLLIITTAVAGIILRKAVIISSSQNNLWMLDGDKLTASIAITEHLKSIPLPQFEKDACQIRLLYDSVPAIYKGQNVWLKVLVRYSPSSILKQVAAQKPVVAYLAQLRDMEQTNINAFLGLLYQGESLYYTSAACSRGSLAELLDSIAIINNDFQISVIIDCLRQLRKRISGHAILHSATKIQNSIFVAPEVMNDASSRSLASDIYSVGMILHQIVTGTSDPTSNTVVPPSGTNSAFVTLQISSLILSCCNLDPSTRPNINKVVKEFELATGANVSHRQHVMEKIIDRLETYTNDLDDQVALRTTALLEERRKCDILLREMLPSSIVEKLRNGSSAQPELYDSVTILFSEIGAFQQLLTSHSPKEIMFFLNCVYSLFDEVILQYEVYKVETVKDSYMVSSGLPIRNGNRHVKEICNLALAFEETYVSFMASTTTSLRIGIHSGPCAAGVIGHAAPRFCLFGDTVNTAARMLSHGEDSKIHLSEATAELLSTFPGFVLSDRGPVDIKGKGTMRTFWLLHPQYD